MKQVILGTAGHIDHGKTSLIKALTGIDTDRLKEEKERGITIELGFAYLNLPSGQLLGIVDVPGHEKFVKNMVAGATGIDIVAMVIAADEGVMPQTREHLDICKLLGVSAGLVVLTKIDMVDDDWLKLVREDLTEFFSGTFLENAPVIEVSSITGQGIENLLKTIDELVNKVPERETGNFFRLPVDRVFTMKGFGTVVTGTTISGTIKTGSDITIYPQGISSKIRGIQVHNRETDHVKSGQRTAINIQGIEKEQIERGDVLAARDTLRATHMMDVEIELLSSAQKKLKNRSKCRFHSGTAEIISTIILLDRDELKQGESCFAQIRLEQLTSVLAGDRFILRSYSPVRTIGGGRILNPLPFKKKRFSRDALLELETLNKGGLMERTEEFVRMGKYQGRDYGELRFLTDSGEKKLDETLNILSAQRKATQYNRENRVFIHNEYIKKAMSEITAIISRYHDEFQLKAGIMKEELRSRSFGSGNQRLFNYIVGEMTNEGTIVQDKELLRLKEHRVTFAADQEKTRQEIEDIYLKGGIQPPYFKELKDRLPARDSAAVLDVLVKDGVLVKVKEDLYFHRNTLDDLEKRLVSFLKENPDISMPQFKDITGASRKYTVPLMEYFDRIQITVRVGDNRVLRKR
ncbi:MAG: selenocysteine-specific translation elongation factor [Deltaproteobacteria bacterium]|nr:selenocysteine-specific translation elongation factor [Deltaproteobacteria bacterium]